MLVFSAADFEDFQQLRPEVPPNMEDDLEGGVRILAENRWPWRMHATYDETISHALDVFEMVDREVPIDGLNWFFDHAETISERSMDRVAALGGGVAVQHRMAYQGEFFVERYGNRAAEATPPVAKMLEKGIRASAGSDATRVASYNPWVALAWLVTGRTVGGMRIHPERNASTANGAAHVDREGHLVLQRGRQEGPDQGRAVRRPDRPRPRFLCLPSGRNRRHDKRDLTIVGGRVVYGGGDFSAYDTSALPPAMAAWSPARTFGGYGAWGWRSDGHAGTVKRVACGCNNHCGIHGHAHAAAATPNLPVSDLSAFWGALGCACWAV